mgnify:CR=1 FL=1
MLRLGGSRLISTRIVTGVLMITKAEFERDVEPLVGTFSRYKTTIGHGERIPFNQKPAQQLLLGLGCISGAESSLSETFDGAVNLNGIETVKINPFDDEATTLQISKKRIAFLLSSAKTYLNKDIISADVYRQLVGKLPPQSDYVEPASGKHIQNLSTGICHVQLIDFLSEQNIDINGCSLMAPRSTLIDDADAGVLLLSSPALNFGYGKAAELLQEDADGFILGFYRNLFRATQNEGRQYVSMPAAGLGVFGGDPTQYFNALMKAAKEFPELTIIYNPAQYIGDFDEAMVRHQSMNVIRTVKDVVFVASVLNNKGYLCALHNPSDSDVVLGSYDVGEYWKVGKGSGYVGEEHIGAMTTAPLNSRLLNPTAYKKVIEHCPSRGVDITSNDCLETGGVFFIKEAPSPVSAPWTAFFECEKPVDSFIAAPTDANLREKSAWVADFDRK